MSSKLKTMFKGLGSLLLIVGGIFFLQGIDLIPGSYMSGDPQWAINGAIIMIAGLGLFWFGNRK